jgi:hypothetical protein
VKNIIKLLIVSALLTASCTREIEITQNNTINNSTSVTGNFILTKFTNKNSGDDNAAEYNGYLFSFSVDGKITVAKNNQTALGTYTETYSYDGNPEKLGLYFSNKPLSYLNKSWQVSFISDDAIHLTDVSTGEILEFTAK